MTRRHNSQPEEVDLPDDAGFFEKAANSLFTVALSRFFMILGLPLAGACGYLLMFIANQALDELASVSKNVAEIRESLKGDLAEMRGVINGVSIEVANLKERDARMDRRIDRIEERR